MGDILSILFIAIFFVPNVNAQEQSEIDFVIEFFNELQLITIAEEKEYCGYFGIDENDNFITTKPMRGEEGSCYASDPPENFDYFASYHTHGAFSYDADSELPSSADLEADIAQEIALFLIKIMRKGTPTNA